MLYLKYFHTYINESILIDQKDADNINQLLIDEMTKRHIATHKGNILKELYLVKKDPNSILYQIIQNYYNTQSRGETISKAFDFYKTKYGSTPRIPKRTPKEYPPIYLPYEGEMIKVPSKIGHGFKPIKILPLSDLKNKYENHRRLKVFLHKGLKCVRCDRVGEYLIATLDRTGGLHVDVYTKNFELMTVDHIKPQSKGGGWELSNLDPMCNRCNCKKGNTWEEIKNGGQ
jgi:hypothetical protein